MLRVMSVANRPVGRPKQLDRLSTGRADLDDLFGPLIAGDNVVWASDDPDLFMVIETAFLNAAREQLLSCIYVSASRPAAAVAREAGRGVVILDARARGEYGDQDVLEQRLVEGARKAPPACVIVDGLDSLARRWGDAKAAAFL